jgi:hyperosmotically inducible protein
MARESDDAVRRRVQRVLDQDTETGVYGLKANVINGEVQLTGIVDTLSEKEKVNKIVSSLEGVRGINNGISISTDGALDDEDVTFEVMEELNSDPRVDLKHIGARSVKGTVFLNGTVADPEERDAAVSAASRARGVWRVVSQLDMETAKELTLDEIFHSQVNNEREDKK